MPIAHIQHFLVAADDMTATRDWYRDVLGMQEGPHPEFNFPVHWMYVDGKDVVHIGQSAKDATENQKTYLGRTSQNTGSGTGAFDHIAFHASGLTDMMAHLRRHGVEFKERRASNQSLYQLFLFDPNGIKVELNFDAAEAAGIEPEVNAASFVKQS
jgi:catechol 2,3-dioxygenase-like lactoylglutathione lyase family enzyme